MSIFKKFALRSLKLIVSVGFALSTMTMPNIQVFAADSNNIPSGPGSIAVNKVAADIGGGLYEVTVTITGVPVVKSSDIVLVLDTSASMSGAKFTAMKAAAKNFVTTIIGRGEGHRIAIVRFSDSPVIVQNFSTNATTLNNAIEGLTPSGYTHLEGGIYTARQLLASSTAVATNMKNIVVLGDGLPTRGYNFNGTYIGPVVLTAGGNHNHPTCTASVTSTNASNPANFTGRYNFNYSSSLTVYDTNNVFFNKSFDIGGTCSSNGVTASDHFNGVFSFADSVAWQAQQAWASGYTVYSIGLSVDTIGGNVLNSIDNGGYYNGNSGDLSGIYATIASQILQAGTNAVLSDKMGAKFTFQNISAGFTSLNTAWNPTTEILTWNIGTIGSSPMILKYIVKIDDGLPSGFYPTNEYATLAYTNINGLTAGKDLPKPEIEVEVINTAPTAVANGYPVTNDATLDVAAPGVLSNDTDPQGDSLTAVLDVTTNHGTLTLHADGSFHYVPNAGYVGTDTFTYHANDGSLDSNIATVTITVNKGTSERLSITNYSEFYDAGAHGITINNLVTGDVVAYSLDQSNWSLSPIEYTTITSPVTVFVKVTNPSFLDRTGSGTVEVKARPITLTANSASRAYNGLPLTANGAALTGTLATGETLNSVTVIGSQTNVGSSVNLANTAKIVNGSAVDVTANYAITYVPGLLTVTAAEGERLNIIGYNEFYDADAHSISIDNLVSGDVVEYSLNETTWVSALPTFTLVTPLTTVYVRVTNPNFAKRSGSGTVQITKRPITIKANDDTKVFDGTALTNDGYSKTLGTLAPGEDIRSVTVLGSQTDVGFSDNIASAAVILNGAEDRSSNYDISYTKGTLTVTKATGKEIEITNYSEEYDAAAHSISFKYLLPTDTVEFSLDNITWDSTLPTFTDVTPLTTVYVRATNPNYVDRTGSGTVEITARHITIKANDDSKTYDGTPLTNDGYGLTLGTLALGESFDSVSVVGSQTNVGFSDNVASAAVILNGTTDVSANYDVAYDKGTLTVTKEERRSPDISDFSGVYDAAAHSITLNSSLSGDVIEYSLDEVTWDTTLPTFTNVTPLTTVYVRVTNPNYFDTYGSGTVEITARHITIKANDDSKMYDGSTLTNDGYSLSLGDLAIGDGFSSVSVVGSQTDVGSSSNVASLAVIRNEITDVSGNYDVTYEIGTLTVTRSERNSLDISDYSGEYDALAHSIALNNSLPGDVIEYSLDEETWGPLPAFTDLTPLTTVYVRVTNPNYFDSYGSGTVEITARHITIKANDDSKMYDGTPLTNDGYSLSLGNLATGDGFSSVSVVGSQTDVGSSSNVASLAVIRNEITDVSGNYDVTYVNGTLTVSRSERSSLDISDYTGTYDAAAHSISLNNALPGDVIEYSLDEETWGPLPSFTNVTPLTTVYVRVTNPNYYNANGSGTVEITSRAIAITANSGAKTFDGLALTNTGYSLTGGTLATGESFLTVVVTGSQTAVGSSANIASAAVINNGSTDVSANYAISYVAGTLTITAPINVAPTSAGAIYTIPRGATITRLLARGDANGDALTFQIMTLPARGTLAVTGAGSFTYSNNGLALTSDTFTYRVFDGTLYSPISTIRIDFTELPVVNTAPVVRGASFSTPFKTALNEDVAPLGSDADGNPLTFIVVTQPANGTLTLSPSGSFHYVPNPTFSGVDTFTFKSNDGIDDSNIATVTINVDKEIIITPEETPQAQMPWWWLLGLLPFLLFLIRRPRPEVQEVVMNPDGTVTTTWGYLGPRLMHKDYDRDESILEVVSGDVKVVPTVENVPYEFDRGRHSNIFKTVSDKNAVIRWTIKKKAEELDKELIEKMLEKNKK